MLAPVVLHAVGDSLKIISDRFHNNIYKSFSAPSERPSLKPLIFLPSRRCYRGSIPEHSLLVKEQKENSSFIRIISSFSKKEGISAYSIALPFFNFVSAHVL